jgi:hypothetical protein
MEGMEEEPHVLAVGFIWDVLHHRQDLAQCCKLYLFNKY